VLSREVNHRNAHGCASTPTASRRTVELGF
jgi:hypothetical protein